MCDCLNNVLLYFVFNKFCFLVVLAFAHSQNTLFNDVQSVIKSMFKTTRDPAMFNLYTRYVEHIVFLFGDLKEVYML